TVARRCRLVLGERHSLDDARRHPPVFSARLQPCRAVRVKTSTACSTPDGHARTCAPTASAARAVPPVACWTSCWLRCAKGGTAAFTHLDIGGGVGVLQHELARAGAAHAAVDASRPYLECCARRRPSAATRRARHGSRAISQTLPIMSSQPM